MINDKFLFHRVTWQQRQTFQSICKKYNISHVGLNY